MNIGILHLSDLHISDNTSLSKVDHIVKVCNFDVKQVSHLYIILSGDIVNFGREEEYAVAKLFLDELKNKITPKNTILQIQFVIVPGNHDCCFDKLKATRSLVLKSCLTDIVTEEDYFSEALSVQDNFWNFYNSVLKNTPTDKISYVCRYKPKVDTEIIFHCYNTSWMSEKDEIYGQLVIPENKFLKEETDSIVISLFHHPLSWLSPNTNNNNKSRFEEHLISSSNLVFYGHEHDKGIPKDVYQKNNNVIYSEGKALQKRDENSTGFSFLTLDLESKGLTATVYKRKDNEYVFESGYTFNLLQKEKRKFTLDIEFEKKLDTSSIPLKHSKKNDLRLSDIFIFPDLEPLKDDDVIQYPSSEEIYSSIKEKDELKVIIEGEDQSGKTTLLFALYRKLYDVGFSPIYVRGKNLNNTNVRDIIKKAIKDQYNTNDVNSFIQHSKIVFLIDNLHKSSLNSKHKITLLNNLKSQLNYIVITSNRSLISNLATDEINSLKDFDKYKLLPLGHEKRGELIERWLKIGEDEFIIREEQLLCLIKTRLDEINLLLGNRLMPSYPIFILTLLQGLDAQIFPQDYTQTSYAHCYQALITVGLVREGLKDSLNSYFNLLKELSFNLFDDDEKRDVFNIKDFEDFLQKFKDSYFISHASDQILQNLLKANILKFDDEYYSFSYKYIFYYLVAQKIASNIDKYENLIESLCSNIHLEKNANILIFLSHHTKAQLLLDNILFVSELPFEKASPITLDKDDPFTKFIFEFVKVIQHDIIEEKDPNEELKKSLQKKDQRDRKKGLIENDDHNLPQELIEINQAFRTIKILGQIIKNQKGDFEKKKLEELVDSAYRTCFRYIGFFTDMLSSNKDEIIEAINDELQKRDAKIDRDIIEKQVLSFLQFISYRICIDGFTNLMFSIGTKGVDELYEAVTKKIGTSAAKIVTFAIKSYYGHINTHELESLFKDVENNYIAQSILRIYVRKYLYTNHVERTKKEKIIKIVGFKPNIVIQKKVKN